jgi:HK97 family phage portal protein
MTVVRGDDGALRYAYQKNNETVELPASEVLHVVYRSMPSGLVGMSPIQEQRNALGLASAAELYGGKFFANDARPGIVLEHPGKLGMDAMTRLKTSWTEAHAGAMNAGKPAILEEGMKLNTIGMPPADAQFLETRKFQLGEIARIYRVPPHMLADLERATFSNIEHQAIEFVTHTIMPWLVRWERALVRQVLLPSERKMTYVKFILSGLLRGDVQSRYAAYATARQWGWMSVNEIREYEEMNPVEEGDQYLVPMNMVEAGGGQPESVPEKQPGDQAEEPRSLSEQRMRSNGGELETRASAAGKHRHKLERSYSRVLRDVLARSLRREVQDITAAAAKAAGRQGRRDYGNLAIWLEEYYAQHRAWMEKQLWPASIGYADLVSAAVAEELKRTDEGVDEVENFVKAYVAAWASRHSNRSAAIVRETWRQAEEAGEDPAAAVATAIEPWPEERAEAEGVDESVRLNNAVAVALYVSYQVRELVWISFDENCPYCDNLNGRIVGISEPFLSEGDFQPEGAERPLVVERQVKHAPAHRGCDCMVTAWK